MNSSNDEWSEQSRASRVALSQVLPSPGARPGNDPVVIRAEMARTRADMSTTVTALRERLEDRAVIKVHDTAAHLKDQTLERIRAATIGKVEEKARAIGNNVKTTVIEARHGIPDTNRHNPIPVALIGIGLAALLFKGSERWRTPPAGRDAGHGRSAR